jgi:hypothetical protein
MTERHKCIANDAKIYREMATVKSDAYLLKQMREWKQFKAAPTENNRLWRAYVGVIRREAHKRGIWTP